MNESERVYFKMFRLENKLKDIALENGNVITLNPGYYKFNYCLSGNEELELELPTP